MTNMYFMEEFRDVAFNYIFANDKDILKIAEIIGEYEPKETQDRYSWKNYEEYEKKLIRYSKE